MMFLFVLVGCALAEEDFAAERAVAECKTMRRCYRAQFDGEHEGLDDCISDLTAVYDASMAAAADSAADSTGKSGACTYDGEAAAICVSDIRTASCEAYWDRAALYEECEASFVCR
ncbi:MAG: hypothetical protein AAFV53_02610 [Myxococcota bacterium]